MNNSKANDDAQLLDYLRVEDADAVERVCNLLDAVAKGSADSANQPSKGFVAKAKKLVGASMCAGAAGMLRNEILPKLRAAASKVGHE